MLDADPRRVKKVKIYRGKDRSARRERPAKRRDGRPEGEATPPNALAEPNTAAGGADGLSS